MALHKQLLYLMKQELRSALRSRYIIISFVILPFLMWGLEGGAQVLIANVSNATPANQKIYISNSDNGTVKLTEPFQLPFDFQNHSKGYVFSTNDSFSLSDYFVASIKWEAENNNNSALYHTSIIDNMSINEIEKLETDGKVNYWLKINSSFSDIYAKQGFAVVQMDYLQTGIISFSSIQLSVTQILASKPFTIVDIKKIGGLEASPISIGGEESGFSIGLGLAGLLAILLSVVAPSPFISTSFAGEREKKTLESLLALPISRKAILFGKLLSGMVLVGIFTIFNIGGMYLYTRLISSISGVTGGILSFDFTPTTIAAISITMFLSAFISIGLGISLASFAKDVRTSESLYNITLMFPSMIVGFTGMFAGVPENIGGPALFLYLIPYTHTLAIFQKLMRPSYYDVRSLTGFGLIGDLIFHFAFLIVSIAIVLWVASKVFERESILN